MSRPSTKSGSPLRWGLIGASTIAHEFMVPAIEAVGNQEVVAVCSASSERAATFAREHGIERGSDDLASFLASPEIDAVYISTTNDLHAAQTVAAAQAGKHVLCEKPLALDLQATRRMIEACADAGVVLAVNHHFRNGAWNRAARDALRRGAIGRPLAARVSQAFLLPEHLRGWRLRQPALGAGAIFDLTVHTADTLRFLLDADVEEVAAASACQVFGEAGVEDVVMGVMRLSDGVLASFYDAFNAPHAGSSLEVHGTEGSIVIDQALDERLTGVATLRDSHGEELLATEPAEDLYVYGLRRFAAAVAGEGQPAAGGEDGLQSLAIALAVRDAAGGNGQCAVENLLAEARV